MDYQRVRMLYLLVRENQRLAYKRHPMFERNTFVKLLAYLFSAFWAVYIFCFGIAFFFIFNDTNLESFDWINGGMIFFLIIDFLVRFGVQDTPAQDVRCYKLLPVPMKFLINVFLLRMGLRAYNLFWMFFLLPFGFLAVPSFYGFAGLAGFLFGWWLMFVLNSYWYLIWRTYINRNMLAVIIPLCLYAALVYFGIFFDDNHQWLFYATLYLGRWFMELNVLGYLCVLAVIVTLFFVNGKIQRRFVYIEISKDDKAETVKSRELRFLDRFGEIGEYMRLEIKSMIRNKIVRKQFLIGVFYMCMLCALFAFSDVYDNGSFMKVFICVYCFACLGTMTLTNVMCMEGNYIDGLMSRKESVLSLLKAKYYFNCAMLLFPLLFSVMPVVEGKVEFVTILGCMFFSMGVVFPFLFQLAVYNNNTIHLNEKLTRAGRSTKMQGLFSSIALFLPCGLMYLLVMLFSEETASLVMLAAGVAGTVSHPWWLRDIYNRFMKRRYVNMDGFRNSRQD
ncbi:MAG: DUF5687 family protein [Bacteroides sp.]|nr:DUF5687 family protein [Bacteroides sp.]